MTYEQSKWLYDIFQKQGFNECVEAVEQNIEILGYDEKLNRLKQVCLQKLEKTTVGRSEYIQTEIGKYEQCLRDCINQINDIRFCDVYNIMKITWNYVLSKTIIDILTKRQVITPTQNFNPRPQQKYTEQQPKSQPARDKGRPKETLKDKMINDTDGTKLKKIHKVMDGKKGKDAALIVLACIQKGWMQKPTFTQVTREFGEIGTQQGFTKYLNKNMFSQDEIEGAKNSLDES